MIQLQQQQQDLVGLNWILYIMTGHQTFPHWSLLIQFLRENTTSRFTTKRIQNNPRNLQSEKSKLSLHLIISSNLTFSALNHWRSDSGFSVWSWHWTLTTHWLNKKRKIEDTKQKRFDKGVLIKKCKLYSVEEIMCHFETYVI